MTREERQCIGRLVRTMRRILDDAQHQRSVEWILLRSARADLTLVEIMLGGGEDDSEDPDD